MESRATKIVATIGPRADRPGEMERLLRAGVDVVRINGAHCRPGDVARKVARVRVAEGAVRRPVGILLDLGGPKIRVGPLEEGRYAWNEGDVVQILPGSGKGSGRRITVTYPALLSDVEPGQEVRIDDGRIRLRVEKRSSKGLVARVLTPGEVRSGAGVNFPSSALTAPALTPKDRRDLREGLAAGIDLVGLSFVRSAEHVHSVKRLLAELPAARRPWVVAKIERVEALKELREIARAADAMMVARGDLGVEIGLAAVPGAQHRIVSVGRSLGVPVIVATQMLESMVESPVPTRAEVSDVAGAVHEGADAVMLSGETAVGKWPVEAVTTMAEIARTAERTSGGWLANGEREVDGHDLAAVAAQMAARAAGVARARAMVVYTATGRTARLVSKEPLSIPIVAITPSDGARRRMALLRNVVSVKIRECASVEAMVRAGDAVLRAHGLGGETVVEVSGWAALEGATNTVRIRTITAPRRRSRAGGGGAARGRRAR